MNNSKEKGTDSCYAQATSDKESANRNSCAVKASKETSNNELANNHVIFDNDCDETACEWNRFSQWFECMCVVTFDLNLGQALELVYPPNLKLSEQEISNICYMAFPDSNSGCMGDTKFHMRFRISVDSRTRTCSALENLHCVYNSECLQVLRADQSHYWGFVYFRQRRDASLPRGYFQKSFILVTRLPFFNLYFDLLSQLAPKYFDDGIEVLQQVHHQINAEWPSLEAGVSLTLPVFDQHYQVVIPKASSRKVNNTQNKPPSRELNSESMRPANVFTTKEIASVHELELFPNLSFVIDNLYTLWELVLIAEPIVVIGSSPADCSQMVQTLTALIAPLEHCAEVRPYFTIHDSEFKEFTRDYFKLPPNVVLGVTNPYFVKLFKDWPHMLRLPDSQLNIAQQQMLQKKQINSNSVTSFGASSTASNNAASSSSISNDGSACGLHTKYKPFLKKDKSLIKKVLLGMKMKRPEHVQTALIRRHMLELTQSFMIPLERYLASLMPLQKDISPFKSTPNANCFKLQDFLATLELSGPQLTSPLKGDWKSLYRRFFNSPNFRGWYESRHLELQLTLQDLQLQALSEANLVQWARDKQEVEIIDMILKLKQKLNLYTNKTLCDASSWNSANSSNTREQILSQISVMKSLLPSDLKEVVNI